MDFDLLYQQELFKSVDRIYARSLFKDSTMVDLSPNEYLFHHGTVGRGIYFLIKGSLQAILEIDQGKGQPKKELILDTLKPYSCFGEICFLEEQPRTASIKAIEYSECLYLDRQVLSKGLRQKNINAYQLNINLGRIIAGRFGKLTRKIHEFCKNEPQLIDMFAKYL